MKKIYLVSNIEAYSDECLNKKFEIFKTKKEAIEYKNWLVEAYKANWCDYYECDDDELEDWIEIMYETETQFKVLEHDGTEEIDIEIIELDISSIE